MLESSQCGSQGAQYIDSWQNIAHNLSAAWALIGAVQCSAGKIQVWCTRGGREVLGSRRKSGSPLLCSVLLGHQCAGPLVYSVSALVFQCSRVPMHLCAAALCCTHH